MTKIVDRRQKAVGAASAGCQASPSERATSRVVTRGAPRRRAPGRRHAACFISKHCVPFWNIRPCSTPLSQRHWVAPRRQLPQMGRAFSTVGSAGRGGDRDAGAGHPLSSAPRPPSVDASGASALPPPPWGAAAIPHGDRGGPARACAATTPVGDWAPSDRRDSPPENRPCRPSHTMHGSSLFTDGRCLFTYGSRHGLAGIRRDGCSGVSGPIALIPTTARPVL